MPFDALTYQPPLTEALAAQGIVSIPWDFLAQHRDTVVLRHGGIWNICPLANDRLERELWAFGASRRIRRLALRVRDTVPNVQFVLGYHDRDPYLLAYRDDERVCLAIWLHRFWTVAIAQH